MLRTTEVCEGSQQLIETMPAVIALSVMFMRDTFSFRVQGELTTTISFSFILPIFWLTIPVPFYF